MRSLRLPLLLALATVVGASAQENVKVFPNYQCRYTLPGKNWYFGDPVQVKGALCVAGTEDGLAFILAIFPVPAGSMVDSEFVAGFDENFYRPGVAVKRAGRLTTFKGLPCYATEATANDQSTVAIRMIIANGFGYRIQMNGHADPVEKRADFESVMNGFDFTSPPVPPTPATATPADRVKMLSRAMGSLAACCLFVALVVGLVVMLSRQRKRR
jgi:hypothetical protein